MGVQILSEAEDMSVAAAQSYLEVDMDEVMANMDWSFVNETLTGACTADDQAAINAKGPGGPNDANALPAIVEWCAHPTKGGAYSFLSGFSQDNFYTCLKTKKGLSITEPC